jgi:hypothetical protein
VSLAMARMRHWLQITGFRRKPLHTVFLVVVWGHEFNYLKEERVGLLVYSRLISLVFVRYVIRCFAICFCVCLGIE